jgi:16S rRNA (adenine1518-N6/adenine1519-N6)-dimethyltransferase
MGHKTKKRFGQNFLNDQGVIANIVKCIHPKKDEKLIEIGPGVGALTTPVLELIDQLDVVELDKDLIPILKTQFFNYPGFNVHQGDALSFDFSQFYEKDKPLRIIGNLPYNISTPLIFYLLSYTSEHMIQDMHFMLQKEVVDRLVAGVGDSSYGRLGIMAQYFCSIEFLFTVYPESFTPPPKVDSAIVRLTPHHTLPYPAKDFATFKNVVRHAFTQRRKTLRNTLKNMISADNIDALGIDSSLRPECITLAEFVTLSDAVYDQSVSLENVTG